MEYLSFHIVGTEGCRMLKFGKVSLSPVTRASEKKFPEGTKVDTGSPNLVGPPSLIGAYAVKSFFVRW